MRPSQISGTEMTASAPKVSELPRVGDVVFFRSSVEIHHKTLHAFIEFGQRIHRVKNPDLIHAAILISPFELVDARMKEGVRASKVADQISQLSCGDYVVLRKERPLYGEAYNALARRIAEAAYYFYREAYDLHGLGRAFSDREVRVGSSICSVFVKKVLIRCGEIPAESCSEFADQVFPGELFDLLIKQGYREVPFIVPFETKFETQGLLETMEEDRTFLVKLTDLANSMVDGSKGAALFDELLDDAAVRYLVTVSGYSVLELLERQLERVCVSSMSLDRVVRPASNWRDQERHSKWIEGTLRSLERDAKRFYRLQKAIGSALELPGYLKKCEELERLKMPNGTMSDEKLDAVAGEWFSDGRHALIATVQLTGCSTIKEWYAASSRFLREMRVKQETLKKSWSAAKNTPPDFYSAAKIVVRQIQATIRLALDMLALIGTAQAQELCPKLIDAAHVGLAQARQRLAESGVPFDKMRDILRASL